MPGRYTSSKKSSKKNDASLEIAKKALALAKSNSAAIEVKRYYVSTSAAAQNFGTSTFSTYIDNMPAGTGEGQVSGTSAQMRSADIRVSLQNTRTGCPDLIRVMLVRYPEEGTLGTLPSSPPLDTGHLPGSLHSGVDYARARLLPFAEDTTIGTSTLRYQVLYDKVVTLASLDEGAGSIRDLHIHHKFTPKQAYQARDPGTITTHAKGLCVLWILGSDVTRAAGVSSVDYKVQSLVRYRDA